MKRIPGFHRPTLSQSVLAALVLLGAFAACIRRVEGWSDWSRLKATFPWGLCSGLDVFCGLGLAAGGFAIAAALYLGRPEIYRPILRASMLIGFLGLVAAVLVTVANRPLQSWAFTAWSPWGAYSGPLSALALYGALLVVEFASDAGTKAAQHFRSSLTHFAAALLAISAAALSATQQGSLSKLLVMAPVKFSPLWITPMLPIHMFLSSILACLAFIAFASWHVWTRSDSKSSATVIANVARVMSILLPLYVGLRFLDLFGSPALPLLFKGQPSNYYLGIELCLFVLPVLLLLRGREAWSTGMLYWSAVLVIAGFAVNRLNVAISAREAMAGVSYTPRWIDLTIASGVIAFCVLLFSIAVRYFAIFPQPALGSTEKRGAVYASVA